ncbi:Alpha-D-kanosaminyltransferase [Novipirellula galeiformis]|uniref:Alpha-D-kanosaminyltransferase n=1 Tax=Novipirellula galeiformis TaxID=2528004 RepID=A0A5C6C9C5_9BACT|nr:glycosyltransferase family 4 protein [Novipirellula galeiformis]TWU21200.1 Alpha-D-kanosaminyltransferase [Novipirellula galeiformis]
MSLNSLMNDAPTVDESVGNETIASGVTANARARSLLSEPSSHPLVLHVRIVSGTGGGPEKTILHSPRFLHPLGYDCVCVYLRDPADEGFAAIQRRAETADAPLVAVDDAGATDYRIYARLDELLKRLGNRPLIWHGHDYKSNLAGLWLRRRYPMQLVSTVHGWVLNTWKTPLYYAIDRWCLRRYEAVVCVSTDLFDACRRGRVPADRLSMIDNAIDTEQYRRRQTIAQAKAAIDWPESRKLIGAVGRLSEEKGFAFLIDAVGQLVQQGHDVGLVIVGDGPLAETLKTQIEQQGLSERIRMAGFVANPETYYQAFDVYALSSLREGLPNVLLEAMAFEVPIVATRIAGVPRLIDGHRNGLLVSPSDPEGLAAEIKRVLEDAALAGRLGQGGRETVVDKFCFQKRMEKMAEIYRSLA